MEITSPSVVDPESLRLAMRQWATGVTLVTSTFEGTWRGMTVSSFTSVSLAPPLVLISLEQISRTYQFVKQSGVFGVTVLAEGQQDISDRFAGRTLGEEDDRFANIDTFILETGSPFLAGGIAYFDCRVIALHQAGNHCIIIGQVCQASTGVKSTPLLYYDRAYRWLKP